MRYLLHFAILLLLSAAALGQSTVVSATITDVNGNPYANASITANFQNPSNLIANWNNFPLQATTWTTGANSVGSFSMTLPDLNFIAPATGTFYVFNICLTTPPTLGQPSTPCFTYTSPACPTAGCITGATINITAAIEAVPPPLLGGGGSGGGSSAVTVLNCAASGTILNGLVTSTTQTIGGVTTMCVTTAAASTQIADGICKAGCGTTGNAVVVTSALAGCIFDNQSVPHDYAVPSSSPGQCHDVGASKPNGTVETLGLVITANNGPGGLSSVWLGPLGIAAPGATNNAGNVDPGAAGQFPFYPGSNNRVIGNQCHDVGLGTGDIRCHTLGSDTGANFTLTGLTGPVTAPTAPNSFTFGVDPVAGITCFLTGGGNCALGSGLGAILQNPAGAQKIVQPVSGTSTTAFSANNFNNIRYASQFNWNQSPTSPSSLAVGSNTVTLVPCPPGIDMTNNANAPYYVYVAGTGTPEAVQVTGGSCTAGAASGTIIFTGLNTHSAGYTVQSASSGYVEASNDAAGMANSGNPNAKVMGSPTGANTNAVQIYAPSYLRGSKTTYDFSGVHFQCSTRSFCFKTGDDSNVNDTTIVRLRGARFESLLNIDGVHITNIALTSNVLTVTTDNPHNFSMTANAGGPDRVFLWFYSSTYGGVHGVFPVASVPTANTFTINITHANVSSVAAFGWAALENTAIEDNALNTNMEDITTRTTGSNRFHFFFVVDNDQSAKITNFDNDNGGLRCDTEFCGAAVLARGDNGNSPVLYVNRSNISMQCAGDGILDFSGNSLDVEDTVIQGYAQYGIQYQAGLQNEFVRNTYFEAGSCTNPYYPGSLQAQAGIIHQGQNLILQGGTEASAPQGTLPTFASTGATQYNYYVIPTTSNGVGAMGAIGTALTNGSGTINVYWPCLTGVNSGTVTYDVLRVSGSTITTPYPGQTANIAIATANSGSPSNGMCTFADTNAAASSYTVPATSVQTEGYWYWPAGVVVALEDFVNVGWGPSVLTDQVPPLVFSAAGTTATTVYATVCQPPQSSGTLFNPFVSSCFGAASEGSEPFTASLMMQKNYAGGSPVANLKGRLNFGAPIANIDDVVTLTDSNFGKTGGTSGNRPSNDANDSALSIDQTDGTAANTGWAGRAGKSWSWYVGTKADGSSYLERLTASLKLFTVPTQTTTAVFSSLPTCNAGANGTRRPITDSTVNTVGTTITGGGSNNVDAFCNGTNWVVGEGGTTGSITPVPNLTGNSSVNVVRVAGSDFTTTSASLVAITGLSWTLPGSLAANYTINCNLMYSDSATSSSGVAFGVQDVTTAPTNASGQIMQNTNGSGFGSGVITGLTTTTATSFGSSQPSVTTVIRATFFMSVEQPSGTASVFQVMGDIAGGNTLTVKRGSFCTLSVATN